MTINCKGNLIDLSSPKVMGVLNITPDSFYDGGYYKNEKELLNQTEKMLLEGASFIDVGAYSSKPGATHISEKEELNRILPVVKSISKYFPQAIISVDTFRGIVAKQTIDNGAAIITTDTRTNGHMKFCSRLTISGSMIFICGYNVIVLTRSNIVSK